MSVEAIAERIAAPADTVAYLLADELARGRVSRVGDRWALVADAFPPSVVAALRGLDG